MRRLVAIGLLVVVGAAGCASTDPSEESATTTTATTTEPETSENGSENDTTTTTTTVVVDDRAPGVTDDSIKVGITYTDFEALGDQVAINHGDYEAAYMAVVNDINDRGGIQGRLIDPVFAPVDPSNQVSGDEQCTRLTQDESVFVVLGTFFGESVMCVLDVNETAVVGGEITSDRMSRARAPWFSNELSEDAQVDAVRTLVEQGELGGAVAAFVPDVNERVYRDSIEAILTDAGVDIVEVAVSDSTLDTEQAAAALDAILERFDSSGADTILGIGSASGALADGLDDTDYAPRLAFTDAGTANASAAAQGQDLSVFDGAVAIAGFGPPSATLELGGVTEECYDVQRSAGLELTPLEEVPQGDPRQLVSSYIACSQVSLLVALLDAAGPELNYGTFQAAGDGLGSITLPGAPEPFFFGPPPSADGDVPLFVYEWNAAAREFQIPG
ncbi:MAG: ABC transporter substrate-binding protein [Acidimicrobiales bacterium]|nr:ABC transporter substrate-binding protein [Acidimicrobiales bacterium]